MSKRSAEEELEDQPRPKAKKRVSWGEVKQTDTYSMDEYDRHPADPAEANCSVTEKDLNEMIAWLKENGATWPKLDFRRSGDGYGTHAAEKIEPGDVIASTPGGIPVTPAVVHASEIAADIRKCCEQEGLPPPTTRMLLYSFMVHQRHTPGAHWGPYFRCMPSTFTTPLWWGEEQDQMHVLAGTNLGHHVVSERARLQDMCARCLAPLTKRMPEKYTEDVYCWDNFLWAVSACKSRAYSETMIPSGDQKVTLHLGPTGVAYAVGGQAKPRTALPGADVQVDDDCVMLPLLDMMNHNHDTRVTWEATSQSVTFLAGQSYEQGEEVFNNYGPKANEELLMGYGFCIPNNPHDHAVFKFNISQAPCLALRQHLIDSLGLLLAHYLKKEDLPNGFLAAARIGGMTPTELGTCALKTKEDIAASQDYRLELRMCATLHAMLDARLRAFSPNPTVDASTDTRTFALIEDMGETFDPAIRAAVIYRIGQREVHTRAIECVWDYQETVTNAALQSASSGFAPRTQAQDEGTPFAMAMQGRDDVAFCINYTTHPDGSTSVYTERAVVSGGPLCIIPQDLLITLETLQSSPTFSEVMQAIDGLEDETMFALFLLHEEQRAEESPWHPFLTAARNANWWRLSTVFWSTEETKLLQASPLYGATSEVVAAQEDLLDQLAPALENDFREAFPQGAPDLEDLLWATTLVDLCSTTLQSGPTPGLCLLPLEVGPRYHPYAPSQPIYDPGTKCMVLTAVVDMPPHSEVFGFYGARDLTNEDLLLRYGQVASDCGEPSSITDGFQLDLAQLLPLENIMFESKQKVLNFRGLETTQTITLSNPLPPTLIEFLRVVVMPADFAKENESNLATAPSKNENRDQNESNDGEGRKPLLEELPKTWDNRVAEVLEMLMGEFERGLQTQEEEGEEEEEEEEDETDDSEEVKAQRRVLVERYTKGYRNVWDRFKACVVEWKNAHVNP